MSKIIDPSYLRYIHDGLHSGKINKDNSTALPDGLVGMYEALFPADTSPKERERLLNFFGIWALMKKEVTTFFVAAILDDWTEEQVEDAIETYSKWFNSPEQGKYQLYHERFKVYVLQKMTQVQLLALNKIIIKTCNNALKKHDKDEVEFYSLEHLSSHLYMHAMFKKEWGDELKELSYNKAHWNRQIEISKGFEWTKKMLNEMMLWAGKYDEEEVIECALNKVDLHYIEQNDAHRIVQLVADGDIETALKRIEAFGGNDKEGLQRKFILYMLCLMELTLLDSKDKPFQKNAIEKLLKHLDENLPVDHSLLNWNDFFPSYLMFIMASEWAELGVDYLVVYSRTEYWEYEWIKEMGPFSYSEFNILREATFLTKSVFYKIIALTDIAVELNKQGQYDESTSMMQEAIAYSSRINNNFDKNKALESIALAFIQQGHIKAALNCVSDISSDWHFCIALMRLGVELYKLNKVEVSVWVMQNSLTITRYISDEIDKSSALKYIAVELSKVGRVDESLDIAREISDEYDKSIALNCIAVELNKKGKLEESSSVMKESLDFARVIGDNFYKRIVLEEIAIELSKVGRVDESLAIVRDISDEKNKSSALKNIAVELSKLGKMEQSESVMQESIAIIQGYSDESDKSYALRKIAVELSKVGRVDESLAIARDISEKSQKISALGDISLELSKLGQIDEAISIAFDISDCNLMSKAINKISLGLLKQGKLEKALDCASIINDKIEILVSAMGIFSELVKIEMLEETVTQTNRIEPKLNISKNKVISDSLYRKGKIQITKMFLLRFLLYEYVDNNKSKNLIKVSQILISKGKLGEVLAFIFKIKNDLTRTRILLYVIRELASQGKIDDAISYSSYNNIEKFKCMAFYYIIHNIFKKKSEEDINISLIQKGMEIIQEALNNIQSFKNKQEREQFLIDFSHKLVKLGILEESIKFIQSIEDNNNKNYALINLSHVLVAQGMIKESLNYLSVISDVDNKIKALIIIFRELKLQGNLEHAIIVLDKAIDLTYSIRDDKKRIFLLVSLSHELYSFGNTENASKFLSSAIERASRITSKIHISDAFEVISIELANQGKFEESLFYTTRITHEWIKYRALKGISCEMARQCMIEEALMCVTQIKDNLTGFGSTFIKKSEVLNEITLELAKQGNYTLAEKTGSEIPIISERQSCWKSIAQSFKELHGWEKSLELRKEFKNEEANLYYLKGWSESISIEDISEELIQKAIPVLKDDNDALEHLLQLYAINQLFFEEIENDTINRYNQTLNIQWAIDIKNQINK
jgi:tetratricopeptide (TPR) repeat protein